MTTALQWTYTHMFLVHFFGKVLVCVQKLIKIAPTRAASIQARGVDPPNDGGGLAAEVTMEAKEGAGVSGGTLSNTSTTRLPGEVINAPLRALRALARGVCTGGWGGLIIKMPDPIRFSVSCWNPLTVHHKVGRSLAAHVTNHEYRGIFHHLNNDTVL